MARTTRLKKNDTGTAHYHLMSQANDRKFLFEKGRVKSSLIDALKRAAAFSGIGLEAYTGMDNHFHVVCEVVRSDEPVPEDELLRRVAILKGQAAADELAARWRELRAAGLDMMVEAAQNRLRKRMNDISEFMKTFKEVFNIRFKREQSYKGSIWSGRFKSTLIENGKYLETCRRYVYLNPVRAGIVKHAADYPWCWIAPSDEPSAGSVPGWATVEARIMRRVVQIGEGKIFGSQGFVTDMVVALGDRFRSRSVAAREVDELGYATHGWRLAKLAAKKSSSATAMAEKGAA
jgi:REP element-mobilizing transposase RayT